MRDDHRGPPGQDGAQRRLHRRSLGMSSSEVASSSTRTAGAGQERAGERDQLALPGGQPAAPLAHVSVEAAGQRGDELVRADGPGRGLDLGLAGARQAQPDVVRHRPAEHEVLLGDQDDLAAQLPVRQVPQVHAVQQHLPWPGIVEPGQQPGHGGLPGAGRADQGDRLPGRDGQVQPGQHQRVPVAEAHPVEPRTPRPAPRRAGSRRRQRHRLGGSAPRAARPARRRSSPARPPPTGTSCRTGTGPAAGRRTGPGRAGTWPARRP